MSAPNGRPPRRTRFLKCALERLGIPYVFGGKSNQGLDCSGLVTVALWEAGGPDWRLNYNTDRLWAELPSVGDPMPGDLAFYGGSSDSDVDHVMVVGPLGMVFGACGGDHTTTTVSEAQRRHACVQFREVVLYRSDFRGFRRLPLLD